MNIINFFELKGHKLRYISVINDEILIVTNNGAYRIYHDQDCCEYVNLSKIVVPYSGELDMKKFSGHARSFDEGRPNQYEITLAEEDYPDLPVEGNPDSYTWTQFRLVLKGGQSYEFLFFGESNGYYRETLITENIL